MIRGSCCCKSIKFNLNKQPSMMGTCHCTRCRKLGGSVFVFVEKESFELIEGKEFIATYSPEPPYIYNRNFCKKCGTYLGEVLSTNAKFPVAANCLDDDTGIRNLFHEFVEEKPAWYEICDGVKQFLKHPTKD